MGCEFYLIYLGHVSLPQAAASWFTRSRGIYLRQCRRPYSTSFPFTLLWSGACICIHQTYRWVPLNNLLI